ncbi:MAG: hypothetical protein ABL899_00085 [Nitrospira sp.]
MRQDIAIIAMSVLVAIMLSKTGALESLLSSTASLKFAGSFIAGMFFTSVFTTAPAIVTLGEIAHSNSLILTAFFGALGAVVGDVIIFRFIEDRLSEHLVELVKHESWWKRVRALFKLKYFRWFTFLLGGFIISSPLPDELGIGLLGFSKMKMSVFIPISFFFNFVGIVLIGIVARAI